MTLLLRGGGEKMFEIIRGFFRNSARKLTCAVITPVGPGHENLYRECQVSVERAWRENHGPFSGISHIAIDDAEGRYGRSRARNIGMQRAAQREVDWLFFLDADDLMVPGAFGEMNQHVESYDAV